MLERDREEAFYCWGVHVYAHYALSTGRGDHVSSQAGGQRFPAASAPVLARVAEVGDNGRHMLCPGVPGRVTQEQQLNEVLVYRGTGWLEDENVCPAHGGPQP